MVAFRRGGSLDSVTTGATRDWELCDARRELMAADDDRRSSPLEDQVLWKGTVRDPSRPGGEQRMAATKDQWRGAPAPAPVGVVADGRWRLR
jgi:hypothetical protein